MSIRSFANAVSQLHDRLLDDLTVDAESYGLDPDSEEVLDVIREIFGGEVLADYEDWIE